MKNIECLTPKDIEKMNYNELIGIVRETNRPPGGRKTLKKIIRECFVNQGTNILEIGTSTGFTAIEMAKMTRAKVMAIDINPVSLEEATYRAKRSGVSDNVEFKVDDATNLSFEDYRFDMVFCGNVTSYVPDRKKALGEYFRVLKNGGILVAIPMYYIDKPSRELTLRVSEAMGSELNPEYKDYWEKFFNTGQFSLELSEDYRFDRIPDSRLTQFVEEIFSADHLTKMRADALKTLRDKYSSNIRLFSENLSHMGYTLMMLRKEEYKFDSELFTSTKIGN